MLTAECSECGLTGLTKGPGRTVHAMGSAQMLRSVVAVTLEAPLEGGYSSEAKDIVIRMGPYGPMSDLELAEYLLSLARELIKLETAGVRKLVCNHVWRTKPQSK